MRQKTLGEITYISIVWFCNPRQGVEVRFWRWDKAAHWFFGERRCKVEHSSAIKRRHNRSCNQFYLLFNGGEEKAGFQFRKCFTNHSKSTSKCDLPCWWPYQSCRSSCHSPMLQTFHHVVKPGKIYLTKTFYHYEIYAKTIIANVKVTWNCSEWKARRWFGKRYHPLGFGFHFDQ